MASSLEQRRLMQLLLGLALLALHRIPGAYGYPDMAFFGSNCTRHPEAAETRPNHYDVVADATSAIVILDSSGQLVVDQMCPGDTYFLKVSFTSADGTPIKRRALITASAGALSGDPAVTFRPSKCGGTRIFLSPMYTRTGYVELNEDLASEYALNLTLPCNATGTLQLVSSSATAQCMGPCDGASDMHRGIWTISVNPLCGPCMPAAPPLVPPLLPAPPPPFHSVAPWPDSTHVRGYNLEDRLTTASKYLALNMDVCHILDDPETAGVVYLQGVTHYTVLVGNEQANATAAWKDEVAAPTGPFPLANGSLAPGGLGWLDGHVSAALERNDTAQVLALLRLAAVSTMLKYVSDNYWQNADFWMTRRDEMLRGLPYDPVPPEGGPGAVDTAAVLWLGGPNARDCGTPWSDQERLATAMGRTLFGKSHMNMAVVCALNEMKFSIQAGHPSDYAEGSLSLLKASMVHALQGVMEGVYAAELAGKCGRPEAAAEAMARAKVYNLLLQELLPVMGYGEGARVSALLDAPKPRYKAQALPLFSTVIEAIGLDKFDVGQPRFSVINVWNCTEAARP